LEDYISRGYQVELTDIDKSFKSTVVLSSFSSFFSSGSITGILGPNGSGKSTLLRIISLVDRAFEGTILFDGREAGRNIAAIRRAVGYAPQDAAMYDELSAIDNLKLFSRLGKAETAESIEELAEAFNMTGFLKKKVRVLSGGMKKRVNLAIALINRPRLLVADEPFAGLDSIQREKTIDFLRDSSKRGMTMILSSHIDESLRRLSDNIIRLNIGEKGEN